MKKKIYAPYFEAARQILDGKPVENLDEIRQECNREFLISKKLSSVNGYYPEHIIVSFVADAENRILNGTEPHEAYGGFNEINPDLFRERGRKVLENAVKEFEK